MRPRVTEASTSTVSSVVSIVMRFKLRRRRRRNKLYSSGRCAMPRAVLEAPSVRWWLDKTLYVWPTLPDKAIVVIMEWIRGTSRIRLYR